MDGYIKLVSSIGLYIREINGAEIVSTPTSDCRSDWHSLPVWPGN
jgi:hypothetical protein